MWAPCSVEWTKPVERYLQYHGGAHLKHDYSGNILIAGICEVVTNTLHKPL